MQFCEKMIRNRTGNSGLSPGGNVGGSREPPGADTVAMGARAAKKERPPAYLSNGEVRCLLVDYGSLVYTWARRYESAGMDAEDVMQEVTVRVMKNGESYRRLETTADRRRWLYRLTVNVCCSLFRKQRTRSDAERGSLPPPMTPSGEGEAARRVLRELWLQLNGEERLIVILHFLESRTLEEAAVLLGRSKPYLLRRLKRVRRILGRLTHA